MSEPQTEIHFGPFRLDLTAQELWRDGQRVALRPKTWVLLRYLAERPERLVTKDELLDGVWAGVAVYEEAVARAIRELRQALHAEAPGLRFIEVVYGRGYRFRLNPGESTSRTAPALAETLDRCLGVLGVTDDAPSLSGRDAERARLRAALDGAGKGRARLIVLGGEAGIGKTRLIADLVGVALERGLTTLVGRCQEGASHPPFWPWSQILRSHFARHSGEATQGDATDLLPLLPELAPRLASPAAANKADSSEARYRLFDAVLRTIRGLATRGQALVVIEDVHWIDADSLALLNLLVREVGDLPMLLVVSYRPIDGANVEPVFSALARESRLVRIDVPPLDRDTAHDLFTELGAAAVDEGLVRQLLVETSGNPYFCVELWRQLRDEQAVQLVDGSWRGSSKPQRIPDGIRTTLRRRLDRLTPNTLSLLRAAAVLGCEFDFGIVAAAGNLDADAALDALDEAIDSAILLEVSEAPSHYRFAHALLAETLYDDLSTVRRASLHWRIGEVLERIANYAGEDLSSEIASHLSRGILRGDPDKVVEYAVRAAKLATAACAYEAATSHLEAALRAIATSPPPDTTSLRCRVLVELAESCDRAGDGTRSRQCFEEAAALARRLGDANALARAAFGLATRWTYADASVVALLEEALDVCGDTDPALRARLMARLAQSLYMLPDTRARRETLCSDALTLARKTTDAGLIGQVLNDSLEALFHCDNLDEQEAMASSLYGAAAASGDATLQLQAHAWRIEVSMCRGHLRAADEELATFLARATDVRQPRSVAMAHAFAAALATARGDFASAETHARAAATLGARLHEESAAWIAYAQLMTIRREQGLPFEVEGDQREIQPPDPGSTPFGRVARWLLPFNLAERGDYDAARSIFEILAGELHDLPGENSRNNRIAALASLAEVAGLFEDRATAMAVLPLLSRYSAHWVVMGFGVVVAASVHNSLGLLKGVLGETDAAARHFDQAIAEHKREGAVVVQARTLHNYARLLLRRDARGDRQRAQDFIDQGFSLAQRHHLAAAEAKLKRLVA